MKDYVNVTTKRKKKIGQRSLENYLQNQIVESISEKKKPTIKNFELEKRSSISY